jgi:hypothetical protein
VQGEGARGQADKARRGQGEQEHSGQGKKTTRNHPKQEIPLQDIEDCAIRGETVIVIGSHVVDIVRVAPDIAMADYKGTFIEHAVLEYDPEHVLGSGKYFSIFLLQDAATI